MIYVAGFLQVKMLMVHGLSLLTMREMCLLPPKPISRLKILGQAADNPAMIRAHDFVVLDSFHGTRSSFTIIGRYMLCQMDRLIKMISQMNCGTAVHLIAGFHIALFSRASGTMTC